MGSRSHLRVPVLIITFHLAVVVASAGSATGVSAVGDASSTTDAVHDVDFVRLSCAATRYPTLCVQSLSRHAGAVRRDDRRLALAALHSSLSRARDARAYVARLSSGSSSRAVKDCAEQMGNSVEWLGRATKELSSMSSESLRKDFPWHVSNVQTWVSTAITDDTTCTDGLSVPQAAAVGRRVRADITKQVTHVARVTSNALALVNRFAQHRAGGHP